MPIELLVAGLSPEDANRGVARVGRQAMEELGVEPGDVIAIEGRRRTVAKVLPGRESEDDLVRVDGTTRANAGVGLDERVAVEAVDVRPAETVAVAFPPTVVLRGAEPYVHRGLVGRPVARGDASRIGLLGHPLVFAVVDTDPDGPVIVENDTEVSVREAPLTEEDLRGEAEELPQVTYEDVGGLAAELEAVREMIELPIRHPELFRKLGIAPPKGVLLYGPPGTGKTLLAKAIANEVDATFVSLSGPEIMSKYYGESEQQLRDVFQEAQENAPAIVFIDELDAIAPKRAEVTGEVERRVVAQLLALMDGLEARGDVVVVAVTNRVDAIDPALRRGGRFDREIEIGVPDRDGRHEILQIHTRGMPLAEGVDLTALADRTHGFVGADIESLAKEAAMSALRRVRNDVDFDEETIPMGVLDAIEVTRDDFEQALADSQPSAMREVFVEIPDVTYDDVGGLDRVKAELVRTVEWPLAYPALFEALNARAPRGVLLYGPPGTGKTLLAKAVASESGVNFISVKGPELLDKYVGESERAVREVFERARQNAPAVVFFDEIDAVAPERGGGFDSRVTERVVSQLLTELDGIEELADVVVVGATNRPDLLDPALLRPGRLEKLVYVPTPDLEARRRILEIHARGVPLADDVDLDDLATETEGYAGSDLAAVVREATMLAMDEYVGGLAPGEAPPTSPDAVDAEVTDAHLRAALETVSTSITPEKRQEFDELAERLGGRVSEGPWDSRLGYQ